MGLAVPRREPTHFLNGLHHRLENRHTKGRNKEAIPFWDLLTESALQVLGVKKLKSGWAKRQACLTKCCPKRMLAAKKEEFACMRGGFNFRPIDAQRRGFLVTFLT
ncbi:hypothetical protein DN752_08720 [Echinicola strongylocentroti]|uniref:Uncharacterized protein n=1 Tax=Echinicola strongylocentroti TaxID=1795355 RepID=A0A2Z4IHN0_9BACT|nr:hypothetical protein DN752_08720 [Echinicola strongylocentroti]